MPEVTHRSMNENTRARFQAALQDVSLALADDKCTIATTEHYDGTITVRSITPRPSHASPWLLASIELIMEQLACGNAQVVERNGRPAIAERVTTTRHSYPAEHMTRLEEIQFNNDVEDINRAVRDRVCSFSADLDDNAQVVFHYALLQPSDRGQMVMEAIDRVIDHVHSGRAVRIELPGLAVMLMPRCRVDEKGQGQPESQ